MPSLSLQNLSLDPTLLEQLKGIELRLAVPGPGGSTTTAIARAIAGCRPSSSSIASIDRATNCEPSTGECWRGPNACTSRSTRWNRTCESIWCSTRPESMRVPPKPGLPSKLDLAASIAGAIAVMVESQQDGVGLVCLGDKVEEHIPTRQGKQHLQLIFQHLAKPPGGGGGRLGELLLESAGRFGVGRGVVIVLSACARRRPVAGHLAETNAGPTAGRHADPDPGPAGSRLPVRSG